jgi:tetratricopeptide (TPR) repeat protein
MKMTALLAGVLAASAAAFAAAAPTETEVQSIAAARAEIRGARSALEREDWDRAIARLKAAERLDPGSADVQNLLGFAHRMKGDVDVSFRYYQRALEINPDHRGAHEYIGRSYLLLGQEDKARAHLAHLERTCMGVCPERDSLRAAITEGWPWRSGVRSAQRAY